MKKEGEKSLGIIGGGQLARYLLESARALGVPTRVLVSSAADPAAQVSVSAEIGDWKDPAVLGRFISTVSVVTFENEFVPAPLLRSFESQTLLAPSLPSLSILQDKLSQKELLKSLELPTLPATLLLEKDAGTREVTDALLTRPKGIVLKWSTNGYDGKGTLSVAAPVDVGLIDRFIFEGRSRDATLFWEPKLHFSHELAILGARSESGAILTYPLVLSVQEAGICRTVLGPASALGISPGLESAAVSAVTKVLSHLNYVGVLAIEFFLEGETLWVNELAPRVHNSGHYSLTACEPSQFENHVRACMGLPLLRPRFRYPFYGMVNLIGPKGVRSTLDLGSIEYPTGPSLGQLFWYGKRELRPGRKMGHINFAAGTAEELRETEKSLISFEKEFWNTVAYA